MLFGNNRDALEAVIRSEQGGYLSDWELLGTKIEIIFTEDTINCKLNVRLFVDGAEEYMWSCDTRKLQDASYSTIRITGINILTAFEAHMKKRHPLEQKELASDISSEEADGMKAAAEMEVSKGQVDAKGKEAVAPTLFLRPTKETYYCRIAKSVSERSTCLRRRYGAVIVKDDIIVATGYNGAPRKVQNCCDRGTCRRQDLKIPAGERYELCVAIHAEQNAIMQAGFEKTNGATLYLAGVNSDGKDNLEADCCMMCKRAILNAGIKKVIFFRPDTESGFVAIEPWSWVARGEV